MFTRHRITHLVSFALMSVLSACSSLAPIEPNKQEKNRMFVNLLELHDRSERAFMYHHFCLTDEPINPNFMANFKLISDLLLDESVEKLNVPPQMIVPRILSRRKDIQQQLSNYYHSIGCQSEEGRIAKAHYDAFSNFNERQIKSLVSE